MLSLRFLCRVLKNSLVWPMEDGGAEVCPNWVELVEDAESFAPQAGRLYLMRAEQLAAAAGVEGKAGAVVLVSDLAPDAPKPRASGTWVGFSCSQAKVYNALQATLRQMDAWQQGYLARVERGGDGHDILSAAAWNAGGGAYLLDTQGRVLAAAGADGGPLSREMAGQGALSRRTMEELFPPQEVGESFRVLRRGEGLLLARRVSCGKEGAFVLLLEVEKPREDVDLCALCDCTAQFLRRQLFSRHLDRFTPEPEEFRRLWEDIMARRLTGRGEIRAAFSKLPFPVYKYNRLLIVSFRDKEAKISYPLMLSRLRGFFPQANMTVYEGDILVLLSYEERTFVSASLENDPSLKEFLERYNAIMMVCNGTKNDEGLGSIYLLGKRTIELACLMREDKRQHIFFGENYLIYSIIDLCVQRYLESEINTDILYLTHPAVTMLTRYDREHNSDLRDVLFHYLLNDCNVLTTANSLYMHRNTISNKVNQIKKLTQLELSEPRLRQRLLLSCQIMRYYEIVLQQEMQ